MRYVGQVGAMILLSIVIAGMISCGVQLSHADEPAPRPRFEKILTESPKKTTDEDIVQFQVWHDREGGQEFICAFPTSTIASADKVSCWPSGRSWR